MIDKWLGYVSLGWRTYTSYPFAFLLGGALLECRFSADSTLRRVVAHFLGNLHGAEARSAHGTEVSRLGSVIGQGLVVVLASAARIQGEVELVLPAELETGLRKEIVPVLRAG